MRKVFYIMSGLCCSIAVTAYVQSSLLAAASSKITARIKREYMAAILRQESAWFDLVNYTELPARLAKETATI